ncbi:XRE family transcriptional regulator [Leucobacter sp. OLCS4]|uniref:helix-turn-helix domain-containing protein n=1 Tax=Leucobacter sp. OLCS4 TaxID=1914918 RepID=UPI000C19C377|nr:XRE family transcriptional regulator [Leucobacter sp. OLCS4]PIJ04125.1 XRE family transcriptional regulator [Leucobacter sp. OLCS4]
MDAGAESLARVIGTRVRQERLARGWTLDQLADAAGVSRRMVVSVEQGSVNPSVGTLLHLSDALGLGLPALVEPPEPRAAKVTRAGEGAILWRGAPGSHGTLIVGTEPPDVVELWEWLLVPGDRHDSEAHSEGTRELLHVHEGSLDIGLVGQTLRLDAGDAIAFLADAAHWYENPKPEPARFTLAVFEPGVGMTRPGGAE